MVAQYTINALGAYLWFIDVCPITISSHDSRWLLAYLPSRRPPKLWKIVWWTLRHIMISRKEDPLIFYVIRRSMTLMLREFIFSYCLKTYPYTTLVALLHRLTLKIFFVEVCLSPRCSSSKCFCLPCKAFLILYRVCGLSCEVCCSIHHFRDFASCYSLEKSLQVPRSDKPIFIPPLALWTYLYFATVSLSTIYYPLSLGIDIVALLPLALSPPV